MKKLLKVFLISVLLLLILPVGKCVLVDIVYAIASLFVLGSGLLITLLVIGIPVLIILGVYKLFRFLIA